MAIKHDDMPSMDAEELGEALSRYINSLRTRIVALQEQNDLLRAEIARQRNLRDQWREQVRVEREVYRNAIGGDDA